MQVGNLSLQSQVFQPLVAPGPAVCLVQQSFHFEKIPVPRDAKDVFTCSGAIQFAQSALTSLVAEMLPDGYRHGAEYRWGDFVIALDHLDLSYGLNLAPGQWARLDGRCGYDIIQLHSFLRGISYSDSAQAIFDRAQYQQENGMRQIRKPHSWEQDIHNVQCNMPRELLSREIDEPRCCVYRNATGNAIAVQMRMQTQSGEVADVYRTLWKKNGSYRSVWANIYPDKPIVLNYDLIAQFPQKPVFFKLDAYDARDRGEHDTEWIYSALPSGPSDLVSADLRHLGDRSVRIDLDADGIENLLEIDKALEKVGVIKRQYVLPNHYGGYCTLEEAVQKALEDGCILKGYVQYKERERHDEFAVAKAGKLIPSAEIQRKTLLHPFLKESYVAWIYGGEKIGKSWLANAIAQAISTGEGQIGKWRAVQKPNKVLLIDGEMLPDELEETAKLVSAGLKPKGQRAFDVICANALPAGSINLDDEAQQRAIEKQLSNVKVLILDNLQSLTENGGARLGSVRGWLRHLAQKGIAVIVLDHANQEGSLQGSVEKRRIANCIIKMSFESEVDKKMNNATITYEAVRRLYGEDAEPFQMRRVHDETSVQFIVSDHHACEEDGCDNNASISDRIQRMALVIFARDKLGKTFKQIESELKIPKSTAGDLSKAARELEGQDLDQFTAEIARLMEENSL